ncbi:MAG TPA: hypothetical protein PLE92_03590 [Lentisphaeria bacterium]|nr:hypothetical protein [Lentisphaerota bacterium]HQC52189.1 hypothetical protein [Lentisphaeria bacterium]HQL86491.1 hypothetical protein [Lentisphaeria bacterium]
MRHGFIWTMAAILGVSAAAALDFDPGGFSVHIAPGGLGARTAEETNITIRAFPAAFLDNQFALSQSQPGVLRLAFNNEPEVKIGKLTAFLELPKAIQLVGLGRNQTLLSQEPVGDLVRLAIDAAPARGTITAKGYNIFGALAVMLTTDAAPGSKWQGAYWLTHDRYVSPRLPLTFTVIPTIRSKQPKRFETGVHFTDNCINFEGAPLESYAQFYAETGCNAAMIVPGAMSQKLRSMGVIRYYQPSGWLVNGYMIGKPPRPDNVKFQYKDGTLAGNGVCPTVIYRKEEPYFSANLAAPLRKILVEDRSTDHFLCNWEPFMFDFKGCFCTRCQKDFGTFAKLTPAQVAEVWPGTVTEKYRDQWIDFRAWQNAQLVVTIEQTVNAMGKEIGIDAHFAPEVHIKSITRLWDTSASLRQYATMAYADQIPLLNAWGPYPWQTVMQPYSYVRGYNLSTHCLTRDSVDYIREQIPAAKRPRLLGFPHGLQTNLWTTEPESVAIDILTYFLNEYDGQLVYAFPKGYDARYWRALAEANRAIAAFEDFTLDGVAGKGHQIAAVTPYPQPSPRFLKAPCGGIDAEKWSGASMLQSWEYRLGERRLIAIANYWQRGECFARLSFTDLDDKASYALLEPLQGRIYGTDQGGRVLTGAMLRDGVTIHIGAQRVVFLVLALATSADLAVVRPADVAAVQAERLASIKKAFAAEGVELGLTDFQKSFQAMTSVSGDGFELKRVASADLKRDILQVRSALQALDIDVLGGGRVRSWNVQGVEMVNRDETSGLAVDGFWHPAKVLTEPLMLDKAEVKDGRTVIAMRLPAVSELPGLELRKTIVIDGSQPAFTVQTMLHNGGAAPLEFSHRYHNMVAALEVRDGVAGTAAFQGAKPAIFRREFVRQMFTMVGAPADSLLSKAFDMGKMTAMDAAEVVFTAPWQTVSLRASLPPRDLHSVVFWDSQAMPCPTFEPIHRRVTLQPGQDWQTEMRWSVNAK